MAKGAQAKPAHASGLEVGQRVKVSAGLGDFGGDNAGKVDGFKKGMVMVKLDARPDALRFHAKDVQPE